MGGGTAAMRIAAKVAGIGSIRGAAGFTAIPPSTEYSAMRGASRPVSAVIASSSVDDVAAAVQQRPVWELDDWEFTGAEEEMLTTSGGRGGDPIARVVFAGAPTFQEAKDATVELKDAIDQVYSESKGCTTCESGVTQPPKAAMQAFAFLSESPAAQSVVASIASDPNVWNAVLQNEALLKFVESSKSDVALHDTESMKEHKESSAENCFKDSEKAVDYESSNEDCYVDAEETGGFVKGFLQDIKQKLVLAVDKASAYFHEWIDSSSAAEEKHVVAGDKAKPFVDSLFGLAVLVIMIVLLKRA